MFLTWCLSPVFSSSTRPELLSCPASTQMGVSWLRERLRLLCWQDQCARQRPWQWLLRWDWVQILPHISLTCVSMPAFHCLVYTGWLTIYSMCRSVGNASQGAAEPQPETRAVIDLIQERDFTLSVALDGGSVLVTYPYDKPVQPGMFWFIFCFRKFFAKHIFCFTHLLYRVLICFCFVPCFSISVENADTLIYLATVYATHHPKMHSGDSGCPNSQSMLISSIHSSSF